MSYRGVWPAFWPQGAKLGAPLQPAVRWKWLEELRFRFGLAIELLDPALEYVLKPLPGADSAVDVRAISLSDPNVRNAAAAALRSSTPQTFTSGGARLHVRPLFLRSGVTPLANGVLVIADRQADEVGASREVDRRLDATGRWLTAAIEAEISAASDQAVADQSAERLAGVVDVIDTLHRTTDEREIISVMMEALTFWFDTDVRVYQQDLSGAFALHACLPGVERSAVAQLLDGHHIWGRDEIFKLGSSRELEALGWSGADPDTLFAPISVEQTVEWLLTMSGAGDPTAESTLSVLGHIAGARLTDLYRDVVDRQRRDFTSIVAFGDAPFDATVRIALEAIAHGIGATAATVTIYEADGVPTVSVGWGARPDDIAPFVEAGSSTAAPERISVGMRAGAGVSLVLSVRSEAGEFTNASARLTRSAATLFATWMSGALIRRGELRVAALSEYAGQFVGRLRGHLDRLGRLNTGGAVAVVMPDLSPPIGLLLDNVMQVVQEQVRSSDVVGMLETGGAGVYLPEATREVATAVVDRLLLAARTQGMAAARVGVVTFASSSESPETLLERALMNARRSASLS